MAPALAIRSLGGSGGFGMNALLLTDGSTSVLVDYGAGFPHAGLPGVDRLVPDPTPILARHPQLDAVLLTHGHDDHVAAVPFLPPAWRSAPLIGSPLSIALARDRLEDAAAAPPDLRTVAPGGHVEIGAWRVKFVHVTHSLPQSCALVIDCPAGRLVHTGDFKLEPAPVIGPPTDLEALGAAGAAGVDLLFVDSTGALRGGRSGSEGPIGPVLEEISGATPGQLFVSIFSSQLHRLETIAAVARASGRRAALLGRRLSRVWQHAAELGLLGRAASTLLPGADLGRLPPRERLWIVAGCQAEPAAALSRLSHGQHPRTTVGPGDAVVVSASVVPGNELLVARLVDRLLRRGARVIHAADGGGLHASGHGSRDDILEIAACVRPAAVMPVHGDRRHLEAAAGLLSRDVRGQVLVAERGESVVLDRGTLTRGDAVDLPPRHLDSRGGTIPFQLIKERRKLGGAGVVIVRLMRRREVHDGPDRWICGEATARGVTGWDDGPGLRDAVKTVTNDTMALATGDSLPDAMIERIERRVARAAAGGGRLRPAVLVIADRAGDLES